MGHQYEIPPYNGESGETIEMMVRLLLVNTINECVGHPVMEVTRWQMEVIAKNHLEHLKCLGFIDDRSQSEVSASLDSIQCSAAIIAKFLIPGEIAYREVTVPW
jgi:hypothetical protein